MMGMILRGLRGKSMDERKHPQVHYSLFTQKSICQQFELKSIENKSELSMKPRDEKNHLCS